jgi:hypothetical protein
MQNVFGVVQNASGYGDFVWAGYSGSYAEAMRLTSGGLAVTGTLSASSTATLNTLSSSGATLTGGTINGMTIGATTASTGAFTTLSASSTVSGTGFSTYLASPPAIGGTAAAAGTFTTLTTSSTVTHNGGTANGVTYLNGSKVLTSGSALTFDGTNFQVGGNSQPIIRAVSSSTNNATARLFTDGDTAYIGSANTSTSGGSIPVVFQVGGSEQMRLTSTGLGIGTSSPKAPLQINTFGGLDGNGNQFYITNNQYYDSTDARDESLKAGYSNRIVLDNNAGGILFQTTSTSAAGANTAVTLTERARIDSSGNLLVGTTSTSTTTAGARIQNFGGGFYNFSLADAGTTNSDSRYLLYSTGASAYRFYVGMGGTVFATSTTITAISDQRLKENIRDLDDGLATVMALKPRKFDWKTGKGKDIKNDRGFIAQEFETVLPDMIDTWRDPAPEGEEAYKAINANLIPTLVKAIQEQQAMIESLRQRLSAANL